MNGDYRDDSRISILYWNLLWWFLNNNDWIGNKFNIFSTFNEFIIINLLFKQNLLC